MTKPAISFICIYLFFISNIVVCQKFFHFQHYTTTNGLSNNNIMAINQDARGFLYIGTDAGLSLYDGYEFNNRIIPELTDNTAFVEYIARDKKNRLIVTGLMQGIFYQNSRFRFQQYLSRPRSFGKNIPNAIAVVGTDSLIVAETRCLFTFFRGKFKKLYDVGTDKKVFISIETDQKQNIWFGGRQGLGLFFKNDSIYDIPYFLPEFKNKYIIKILFAKPNQLLVGTTAGYYIVNVFSFDKKKFTYSVEQPFEELSNIFINHLYIDNLENLWIATSSYGVYQCKKDKIVFHLTKENGLPDNNIMCTYHDFDGNYWFGTPVGLCKLANFSSYGYYYHEGKVNDMAGIIKDRNNILWMHDGNDLFYVINDTVHKISLKQDKLRNGGIKHLIVMPDNSVFINNHLGLFQVVIEIDEGCKLREINQLVDYLKYDNFRVKAVNVDKNKNVFICTDNAIWIYEKNRFYRCHINHTDADIIRPNSIVADNFGYYWLGDFSNGLYRLQLQKNNEQKFYFDKVKVFKCLKADSSFVTAWIQDLMIDSKGRLWMLSLYNGAYCLNINKNGIENYFLIDAVKGLSSNVVTCISEDLKGNIWFGTQAGADKLEFSKNNKLLWRHFNNNNSFGEQVDEIFSSGNKIFINFREGLYIKEIDQLDAEQPSKPDILLTSISVKNLPDTLDLLSNENLRLNYTNNYITFYFTSVNLKSSENIWYQYQLNGLDKSWNPLVKHRFINYMALPPGKYKFCIRAFNTFTEEYSNVVSYSFFINPPFYKKWWFSLLMVLLFSFIVYSIFQYRLKQKLRIERLRTAIARDLHDDIGSVLSSIALLSDIVLIDTDLKNQQKNYLQKIGQNARNMLESMDDIIWVVNPLNDRLNNLEVRLREFAIPLFESKQIQFSFTFPEQINAIKLPMEVRKNIYLIAKEAINNLIKYAECTQAQVIFKLENNIMEMVISDDGKGFNIDALNNRNGLKNMNNRAKAIGGKLEILTQQGKGTSIILLIKIR